jgi:Fic family protein
MHESKLPPPRQIFQVDHYQFFTQELDGHPLTTPLDHLDFISDPQGLLSPEEIDELNARHSRFQEHSRHINSALSQRQLDRFVIEMSWKSSRIEGNTYTLLDTERLLRENREADGHSKEEASMILNHKRAFETIFAHKESFTVLNLSDILDIHRVIVADLNISDEVRQQPVGITGTAYKPPAIRWQIEEGLNAVVSLVNSVEHPIEKVLLASALLAYLQAFVDGNKRTSRLVANALLLANGFAPLSYRSIDEQEYKQALIVFYETHNLYHFKRLFLEQFRFSVETYFSLDAKIPE